MLEVLLAANTVKPQTAEISATDTEQKEASVLPVSRAKEHPAQRGCLSAIRASFIPAVLPSGGGGRGGVVIEQKSNVFDLQSIYVKYTELLT